MKDTGETLQIAHQAAESAKRLNHKREPERTYGDAFADVGDLPKRTQEKPEISSL